MPRRIRFQVTAWLGLIKSTAFLGPFSIGFIATCAMLHATLEQHHISLMAALFADGDASPGAAAWRLELGYIVFGIWLTFTLACGAFLSSALPHRTRLRVVALWLVAIALMLAVPVIITTIDEINRRGRALQPILWRRLISREDAQAAAAFAKTMGLAIVLSPLGIPLGRLSRRVRTRVASQRFRKLRRRIVNRRLRA